MIYIITEMIYINSTDFKILQIASKINYDMLKKIEQPDCRNCQIRLKSVFCELTDLEMKQINASVECLTLKKGQAIFHEGSRPQGIYCINTGKVKVYKTGEAGKEQIVRLEKEGSVIGYRALLSGELYSCSATAIDTTSICFIPRNVFFNILEKNATLSFQLIKLLSEDLRDAESRINVLAQKPVRERLAEALLILKETYGLQEDNATINVVLSREEMANIVGTATETMIRLLSNFKNRKLIELTGKKIKILNLTDLIKTANITE